MRVYVTGAGGFIGGHLCAGLAARGHAQATSTDACDAVVHLANIAHARASAAELQRVNVEGTRACAERAAAAGARRFVYLSSSLAADPDDRYGRSKREAEEALAGVRGADILILRPPLVYGPGVKANFLALMRAIARGWPLPLASIHNRRSLVYVGNLVDAILRCVEAVTAGKTYAVSDGAPVSTPDLCRALGVALGRPARLWPCAPALLEVIPSMKKLTRSLEVDDAPLRAELGWRPPFAFEEGIRRTAEWYQGARG